jgi:capsular polysaccharide transport system permease protein
MLWVATFGAIYYVVGRMAPPGMGAISFLTTGFVPFFLFRETCGRNVVAVSSNVGLLFYPQIRPLDLAIARTLLEFATYLVVFVILMALAGVLEGHFAFDNPLQVLTALIIASVLGAGLGMIVCSLSVYSNTVERLFGPLTRPLFWISGLFFSVNSLPTKARNALLYNPVLHIIELVRDGCFAGYHTHYVSAWYPGVWAFVLLFFGLTLERAARRRIQLT